MLRDTTGSVIWQESYIAINEVMEKGSQANVSFLDNLSNFIIVIIILSLFTVTFMRIAEGLIWSFLSIFNFKRLLSIEQQGHLQYSRNITLLFLLLIGAFIFAISNDAHPVLENNFFTGVNFLLAFGTIMLYLVIRVFVATTLDWVNKSSFFKVLNKLYYTYSIIAICLTIAGFLAYTIFEGVPFRHIVNYIIGALLVTNVLYYLRCYKIIISNGFSHFFLILYLCTLEILPQVVLAYLILS